MVPFVVLVGAFSIEKLSIGEACATGEREEGVLTFTYIKTTKKPIAKKTKKRRTFFIYLIKLFNRKLGNQRLNIFICNQIFIWSVQKGNRSIIHQIFLKIIIQLFSCIHVLRSPGILKRLVNFRIIQ